MQRCAAVLATCRKQQIPQLSMEGRGGGILIFNAGKQDSTEFKPTIKDRVVPRSFGHHLRAFESLVQN